MPSPISKRITRILAATLSIAALTVGAAGCGSGNSGNTASSGNSGDITQQTMTPGTLTIGTGQPTYAPWVIGDKPESGKGFEAAVSYAVAEKMGFKKSQIKWTRTNFDQAVAPGSQKDWDMNIQQFSDTPERENAVDFSPSYYNETQSVIVLKNGKYANTKSLADLKKGAIGAMVGTTSYDFTVSKIKKDVQTFNDNAALAQALDSNQIDALVVDTPDAVQMVDSGQVKNAKVVGQIPGSEDKDGMGIILPKGSKLAPEVDKAVKALKQDGTITKLQHEWLKEYTTDIPMLES
ncbi:ABC transporter substrate-binding protein [Bifidobacterium sp. ESL0682]|uniref:ABC transporter substrate-binding protein n=1 Tax=Bifidobacterium sp. ESL0682 TaxID=2983212 RepID=UPI0023F97EE1|nr:ABC transporter substrate-binding protein [Bifidobacterium sp. ESL0682]WEV42355.1 ABC transporter substrate-binding protein [Bifidobacterium sp. ESL0682]